MYGGHGTIHEKKARVMAVLNQPSLIGGTVLVNFPQRSKFQGFWREQWSATSLNINSFQSKTCFSESKNGQPHIVFITVYYELKYPLNKIEQTIIYMYTDRK
jgi:hypothetical protein